VLRSGAVPHGLTSLSSWPGPKIGSLSPSLRARQLYLHAETWKSLGTRSRRQGRWSITPSRRAVTSRMSSWQYGAPRHQFFDPLRSMWLASYLQQKRTLSKPSPPDWRHLTPIASTRGTSFRVAVGQMLKRQWWLCVPSGARVLCTYGRRNNVDISVLYVVFLNLLVYRAHWSLG
jgi:hypothetical protein